MVSEDLLWIIPLCMEGWCAMVFCFLRFALGYLRFAFFLLAFTLWFWFLATSDLFLLCVLLFLRFAICFMCLHFAMCVCLLLLWFRAFCCFSFAISFWQLILANFHQFAVSFCFLQFASHRLLFWYLLFVVSCICSYFVTLEKQKEKWIKQKQVTNSKKCKP